MESISTHLTGLTVYETYLVLLVNLLHASLAFVLGDDFTGVFDNDLVRLKSSHGANSKTAIFGLCDLDAIIVPIALRSSLQLSERSVLTLIWQQFAVSTITLIGHDTVMASLSATIFHIAITC